MKKALRFVKLVIKFVVLPLVLLVVAVGLWLVYLAKTRLPDLDAVVTHPSLQAEVRVVRDQWGVPHIYAENEPDAYFALGYAMAQDRLFQMELMLRLARGELAEIAGPPAVPIDKIVRSFRLRAKAEAVVAQGQALSPAPMKAVEAFVAGVNHRVENEPPPFEFSVLRIPRRTYTPADCLTVAAVLPITFADGLRGDALKTILQQRRPDLDVDALFPGYSKEVPVTIMESLAEAEAYLRSKGEGGADGAKADRDAPPSLAALEAVLGHQQSLSDLFGPALGSNSWVLGPSRTRSGKPILANDPHVGFTNPGIWYEAHVQYGDFELYGHYLALVPFALLGHNRHHGWALTMFANDDLDLYAETFHPDDPAKVMYKGEWVDVETDTDTIKIRFGRDVSHTVRVTPHGPILTDAFRLLQGYDGPEIALCWVWQHHDYTDAEAFYRMGHANDCDGFAEAVSLITSPGINVSYADRDGNIAWWAAGVIPIRPDHVDSKQILDGASGKDDFLGYVPFEQNPHLKNPPSGFIVTANNKSTVKPVGPIQDLQGYWQPTDRAGRIEQLIEPGYRWTIDKLKNVQLDDTAYAAPAIVKQVAAILARADEGALDPLGQQALGTLRQWNHRHNVGSVGATIYHALCHALIRAALEDEIGEDLLDSYCTVADHWSFFKHLIGEDESPYWDNIGTEAVETRADVVLEAFRQTVAALREKLGDDPAQWTWGTIHTIEFKHPFGYAAEYLGLPFIREVFDVGPFPASGSTQVINNMIYLPKGLKYDVIAGPTTRRLIDFADPEHSLTVLPTGNSGNFSSPNYGDQAGLFMAGKYREPCFTDEQIEASNTHEMRFQPAR